MNANEKNEIEVWMIFGLNWSNGDSLVTLVLDELFPVSKLDWNKSNYTSLDFELGSQAMHVPIEGICHDTAEAHPSESRLLPDQREFEERDEQHRAGHVPHSCESFSLTELRITYCSASAKYSIFFNLTYGDANIFRPIYLKAKIPPTINHCSRFVSYIRSTPSKIN